MREYVKCVGVSGVRGFGGFLVREKNRRLRKNKVFVKRSGGRILAQKTFV